MISAIFGPIPSTFFKSSGFEGFAATGVEAAKEEATAAVPAAAVMFAAHPECSLWIASYFAFH